MTTPEIDDARDHPPFLAGDRESLETWLELYRTTLPIKIGGLTPEQMCERSVPPSPLTLVGIVRHLTEVERYWLTEVLHGQDLPGVYCSAEHPDGDFDLVAPATVDADLERYHAEVVTARSNATAVGDLDAPVAGRRKGERLNLRWILVHLIEEYARHLGHADLIREAIDGRTGY